jgi:glycosyltransferase involved in cell wall biosynthesis
VAETWERSGLFAVQRAAGRLHVLPHPVAPPVARPAPRPRHDGRLVLATWGHLAPAKGVADLLAALARADDPRLSLIVLGAPTDPAHGAALRAAAAGLPVAFAGAYSAGDVAALRGEADLAVFPSRAHETFGLVVAEARALGFPVLVSDRGALSELVGAGGSSFPAGDADALAARLVALADDPATLAAWAAVPARELLAPDEHARRVAAVYAQARFR